MNKLSLTPIFQTNLDGSVLAVTNVETLTGNYRNTEEYFKARFAYEKQAFSMCVLTTLGLLNKMIRDCCFRKHVGRKLLHIRQISEDFQGFHSHSPEKQEELVSFMLHVFPLLATSNNASYNAQVEDAVRLIRQYYERYLEMYQVYNDKFLTA